MTNHIQPIPQGAMLASDAQLSIRVPSVMLERLRQIAEADQRSVNNVIRLALFEWVNARAAQ
jgi:predicted transcriptional regulator